MENVLKHDGFIGSVKYNSDDKVFHGKIEFIGDLVTFEGKTVEELEAAFAEAIDDYKEICSSIGKNPKKSFNGSFNVRLKPELHHKVALASLEKGISLNQLVNEALVDFIR